MNDRGDLPEDQSASKRITSTHLKLSRIQDLQEFYGSHDDHLSLIEQAFDIEISARGNDLYISGSGESVDSAVYLLTQMEDLLAKGYKITRDEIQTAIRQIDRDGNDGRLSTADLFLLNQTITTKGRKVAPKTPNQKQYIDAIQKSDLVFGIGPAGTGKTYLAVAMAVSYLTAKKVNRLILARPAVEAGESLGFLPGDMYQKVNPYLRPLYDALYDLLDMERAGRMIEKGVIEVAPLAYMRGRTLNDSFIILDEAQNTTPEQMKMFLTRLGYNAKTVVTGDITQIDLPPEKTSGLVHIQHILKPVPSIQFVYFDRQDVVRCKLVQEIVAAYESAERRNSLVQSRNKMKVIERDIRAESDAE